MSVIDPSQVEELRRELLGYCYRFFGCYPDAEDAVQETMLRAWSRAGGFGGQSSVHTWLYRIATNICLDMKRAPQRRASCRWIWRSRCGAGRSVRVKLHPRCAASRVMGPEMGVIGRVAAQPVSPAQLQIPAPTDSSAHVLDRARTTQRRPSGSVHATPAAGYPTETTPQLHAARVVNRRVSRRSRVSVDMRETVCTFTDEIMNSLLRPRTVCGCAIRRSTERSRYVHSTARGVGAETRLRQAGGCVQRR
jgi:RNA polymerase sigma factor (sigma-70 family)